MSFLADDQRIEQWMATTVRILYLADDQRIEQWMAITVRILYLETEHNSAFASISSVEIDIKILQAYSTFAFIIILKRETSMMQCVRPCQRDPFLRYVRTGHRDPEAYFIAIVFRGIISG